MLNAALCAGCLTWATALIAGCGASQTVDPVARAADATAQLPGYRMSATASVGTPAGPAQMTMTGVFDRTVRAGSMDAVETVSGHHIRFTEVFSGLTFYLKTSGLSSLQSLTGGKQWLKFDMTRMLGAMGLGSLPTAGTDPSQFVDFLRAVSSSTKAVGSDTIRGVQSTHYHATVDLSRYPNIVKPADRAAAARSVQTFESALGGHTLPIDAWIDHSNRVRRLSMQLAECVANQHISFAMTMDLYDYGPQPQPQLPAASEAYDLTPLLTATLGRIKFGCRAQ